MREIRGEIKTNEAPTHDFEIRTVENSWNRSEIDNNSRILVW